MLQKGDSVGRSVLVTGGNRGIGLAIARRLAGEGHNVAVTYHSSPPPEDLFAIKYDAADTDAAGGVLDEVARRQGPVEILVTAAGITRDKALMRMTPADYHEVIETNLTGPAALATAAIRKMMIKKWGRIVFVASAAGMYGTPGQANYAAAKTGLIGAARSMAREAGPKGVTVNVLAPGLTNTAMISTIPTAHLEELVSTVPLRRIAQPGEIAHAAAFLTSDEAGYITGAVLVVDGGATMGH
jgi:3-oxoacyl-[acyl-carrier protein] reductase